jgi:hypothetical protein
VLGGTAILSAVNGLTPHMAGAIDIMVVQQPDGSLKCSPFYGEVQLLQDTAAAALQRMPVLQQQESEWYSKETGAKRRLG